MMVEMTTEQDKEHPQPSIFGTRQILELEDKSLGRLW